MKNGLVKIRALHNLSKVAQRFSRLLVFAVVACALFGFNSIVFAQVETSEVLGTVRDSSGAAVAQASVVLANRGTGLEAKTMTDGNGDYDFLNVQIGV